MSPRYRTRKLLKCSGRLSSVIGAIEPGAMRSLRQWQKPTQRLPARLRLRFERLRACRRLRGDLQARRSGRAELSGEGAAGEITARQATSSAPKQFDKLLNSEPCVGNDPAECTDRWEAWPRAMRRPS